MTLRDYNFAPQSGTPVFVEREPQPGEETTLGGFHTTNPEDREPNNTGKIVGALAVALMLGAGGIYAYTASGHAQSKQVATVAPPASPPQQVAAAAPPPPMATPATPPADANTPSANPDITATAPVKQSSKAIAIPRTHIATASRQSSDRSASDRMNPAAASTPAPQQQAVVTTPVTPVSPAAPSDSLASNAQPSVSAPSNAATASDIPQPAAPAQDNQTGATPAQPAPAQPAEQPATPAVQ